MLKISLRLGNEKIIIYDAILWHRVLGFKRFDTIIMLNTKNIERNAVLPDVSEGT